MNEYTGRLRPTSTVIDPATAAMTITYERETVADRINALALEISRARRSIDGNLAKIDRCLAELARLTETRDVPGCESPRIV